MDKSEILHIARQHRLAAVPVQSDDDRRRLKGYVRVIDLQLDSCDKVVALRPLLTVAESDTYLSVITRLQGAKEDLAEVVDENGRAVGILTLQHLREPLFRGER